MNLEIAFAVALGLTFLYCVLGLVWYFVRNKLDEKKYNDEFGEVDETLFQKVLSSFSAARDNLSEISPSSFGRWFWDEDSAKKGGLKKIALFDRHGRYAEVRVAYGKLTLDLTDTNIGYNIVERNVDPEKVVDLIVSFTLRHFNQS